MHTCARAYKFKRILTPNERHAAIQQGELEAGEERGVGAGDDGNECRLVELVACRRFRGRREVVGRAHAPGCSWAARNAVSKRALSTAPAPATPRPPARCLTIELQGRGVARAALQSGILA